MLRTQASLQSEKVSESLRLAGLRAAKQECRSGNTDRKEQRYLHDLAALSEGPHPGLGYRLGTKSSHCGHDARERRDEEFFASSSELWAWTSSKLAMFLPGEVSKRPLQLMSLSTVLDISLGRQRGSPVPAPAQPIGLSQSCYRRGSEAQEGPGLVGGCTRKQAALR